MALNITVLEAYPLHIVLLNSFAVYLQWLVESSRSSWDFFEKNEDLRGE